MASTAVTATSLITSALDDLGIYSVGETLSAADLSDGRRRLNAMMSGLALQSLTIPAEVRETFTVTANTSTYTIGSGADFNTIRPIKVLRAGLLYNTLSPTVERPCSLLTEQSYANISIKAQTSTEWIAVYYSPTFATSNYGTIYLYPTPTTADNLLVLYFLQPLVEFADATTSYQIPPGYEEFLSYNLALRLASPHSRPVPDVIRQLAVQSRANIKRNNAKLVVLSNDATGISAKHQRPWNAETGE